MMRQIRWLARGALLAAFSFTTAGCEGDRSPSSPEDLIASFPEHAGAVLHEGGTIIDRGAAFVVDGALHAELSRARGGEMLLWLDDGFSVRVREEGAEGRASLVSNDGRSRAITHARRGGASYWLAAPAHGGVEEWIHVGSGIARRDQVAASWIVEGGSLRARDGEIDVLDVAGTPKIRVTAPRAYAKGMGSVPVSLVAHDNRIELSVDADGREVLIDPFWVAATSMHDGRAAFTLTRLPLGSPLGDQVLAVGGFNEAYQGRTSVELFDPSSSTWTFAASLAQARALHSATVLDDGRVLVAGGRDAPGSAELVSTELFDPSAGTWSTGADFGLGRQQHVATLLADGRVLATGGITSGSPLSIAEIFDPTFDVWDPVGPQMVRGRWEHTATELEDGRVLIAGGFTLFANGDAHAELFILGDPANETPDQFVSTPGPMNEGRLRHSATRLLDGRVLIAGGVNGAGLGIKSTEIFDPSTDAWSQGPDMNHARGQHTATRMPDGRVLVAGGYDFMTNLATAEIFDPATDTWSDVPDMVAVRVDHAAELLADGRVLAAGGQDGAATPELVLTTTEIFFPNPGMMECACDNGPCDIKTGCDPTTAACVTLVSKPDGSLCTGLAGVCIAGNCIPDPDGNVIGGGVGNAASSSSGGVGGSGGGGQGGGAASSSSGATSSSSGGNGGEGGGSGGQIRLKGGCSVNAGNASDDAAAWLGLVLAGALASKRRRRR